MSRTPEEPRTVSRRAALRGIAGAATLPLLPGGAVSELLEIGRRVRAAMSPRPAPLQALNETQAATLTAIAEIILPETDTPGAAELRVPEFVDLLLAEWVDEHARALFARGMDEVDILARAAFDRRFASCTEQQQAEIVARLDAEVAHREEARQAWQRRSIAGRRAAADAGRQPPVDVDAPPDPAELFFYHCKRFVMTGYFTTEAGMRQTGFTLIPGRFDGCVEIEER